MRGSKFFTLIAIMFYSITWAQESSWRISWVLRSNQYQGFYRGWSLKCGMDIDQDGKREILTQSSDTGRFILLEAVANDSFSVIWSIAPEQWGTGSRGTAITDWDMDGKQEITIHADCYPGNPDIRVFEWNGTDNGIPTEPTIMYDPPRSTLENRTRLEAVTYATNLDSDPGPELLMPVFQLHDLRFMILENANNSLEANAQWHIEYKDTLDGSTLAVVAGDLDNDGVVEIVRANGMNWPQWDMNSTLQILKNIGEDQYQVVNEIAPIADYKIAVASLAIANWDGGFPELYLLDNRGIVLVMKHDGNLAAITTDNFHPILDLSFMNEDLRGIAIADLDRDGKPNIYFGGRGQQVIYDLEYTGGDITNPDNYTWDIVWDLEFPSGMLGVKRLHPGNIKLGNEYSQGQDLDGDGFPEVVMITGDRDLSSAVPVLIVFENTAEPSGVDSEVSQLPTGFKLFQNYPNPFSARGGSLPAGWQAGALGGNPETKIVYYLPQSSNVRLEVFDLLGNKVKTLVDEYQGIGRYIVTWNGRHESGQMVSSGIYIYRLQARDVTSTRKMIFIR